MKILGVLAILLALTGHSADLRASDSGSVHLISSKSSKKTDAKKKCPPPTGGLDSMSRRMVAGEVKLGLEGSASEKKAAAKAIRAMAQNGSAPAQYAHAGHQNELKNFKNALFWSRCAAMQGFGPAQDLFAGLLLDGRGIKRNAPAAFHWFREAAKRNFPVAFRNIGRMYLEGIGVQQDLTKAIHWLNQGATRKDKGSILILQLLKAGRTKEIPRYNNQPRVTVEKGLISRPIPVSAGYSPFFAAIHERPLADSKEVLGDLERYAKELKPTYMFEMARRYHFSKKSEKAFYWFLAGWLISRYDALRCDDKTARQGAGYLPAIAPKVANAIGKNKALATKAGRAMLRDFNSMPASTQPSWICYHGMRGAYAALSGKKLAKPPKYYVHKDQWPAIWKKARSITERAIANIRKTK